VELPVPEHIRPLRDRVLRFVEDRVYPAEPVLNRGVHNDGEAHELMKRLQQEAKDEGLWALGHPKELGGGGLPFLDYVYINEVVGMAHHAIWALGTHTHQDSLMLRRHATAEWQEKYLAPLVAGEFSQCFSMTEPDVASSDPKQLQTTAVLDGDEWVVDGHKWFASEALDARYVVVMVRTEPDEVPIHQAFSMVIVPVDTPGFEIVRDIPVMGMDEGHCELRFNSARVPATSMLGQRGQGFTIAQERLGPGRIFHCMRWLGQAQRAYDLMCERALTRVAFGSPLSDKQLIQKMIFDTAAEIRASRLLTLDAARTLDAGGSARVEIGIIKVVGASMVHNAIDRAIQVFGAAGVSGDFPLERMYRLARFARIYDGPDETHIATVSRLLLKQHRDARRPVVS